MGKKWEGIGYHQRHQLINRFDSQNINVGDLNEFNLYPDPDFLQYMDFI